jgi:coenzyme PQQ precursor peptide PqqA
VPRAHGAGQIIARNRAAFWGYFRVCRRPVALDRRGGASYFRRLGRPVGFPFERPKIMNWETPSFVEIDMSAEIGSYQGEDDNGL